MDKVAELVKAGKVREIADMRDETDLSGLKIAIDLKRGADPDKLMAKLYQADPAGGQPSPATSMCSSAVCRACMGVRRAAGRVDRLAHGRRHAAASSSMLGKKKDKLHLLQGPAKDPARYRQGHQDHPGDRGGRRGRPQPDDRLRHRPDPGGIRRGDPACATSTRNTSSSARRRSTALEAEIAELEDIAAEPKAKIRNDHHQGAGAGHQEVPLAPPHPHRDCARP